MAATIKIKNSSTASAVPTSSDLVQGELAVNVTDKRIFTENASGTVVELGTNPSILTLPDGSASAPTLTNDGDTNTGIFFPAADTVGITTGGTERARVDSSGNLGLGVTPSAWSQGKSVETGFVGNSLWSPGGNEIIVSQGAYFNSGWKYSGSTAGAVSFYSQITGQHRWYNAPTGTAGNAISFTQAMTLDASGNLGIGTTSPASLLHIASSSVDPEIRLVRTPGSGNINTIKSDLNDLTFTSGRNLLFSAGGSERARIDSSGNLLVGTTINAASAKIFSAGPILTDWSGIIALRYNLAGSINSYYKGMTGTAISNGAARGLHIFNYDGDSNPGILFYPNSYAGQTAAASMTLEPGGNLGVGVTAVTTSGSRRVLQLSNSTNGGMLMLNNSATEGNNPRIFGSVSSAYDLGLAAGSSTGFINFYTNGTDRGRFSAAGDLELYITAAKDGALRWTSGGGGAVQGFIYCNGNPEVIVQTGGSGGVKLTSGATSWVTASDTRFKNIIEPIANAVDKVNTLSAVIYSFKDDETAERRVGLIAQELLAVLPEAVHVPKKEEEMMGVRYTETIPLLVAAIKEQSALITQLTARITALEGA